MLSYGDRSRIVPEPYRKNLFPRNGIVPGSILVDGMVADTWRAGSGRVTATPFRPLTAAEVTEPEVEGQGLARFLAAPGESPESASPSRSTDRSGSPSHSCARSCSTVLVAPAAISSRPRAGTGWESAVKARWLRVEPILLEA